MKIVFVCKLRYSPGMNGVVIAEGTGNYWADRKRIEDATGITDLKEYRPGFWMDTPSAQQIQESDPDADLGVLAKNLVQFVTGNK